MSWNLNPASTWTVWYVCLFYLNYPFIISQYNVTCMWIELPLFIKSPFYVSKSGSFYPCLALSFSVYPCNDHPHCISKPLILWGRSQPPQFRVKGTMMCFQYLSESNLSSKKCPMKNGRYLGTNKWQKPGCLATWWFWRDSRVLYWTHEPK